MHRRNKADAIAPIRALIRHDSDRLAKVIMSILDKENKNLIKEVV
jgi:hypothetical protein